MRKIPLLLLSFLMGCLGIAFVTSVPSKFGVEDGILKVITGIVFLFIAYKAFPKDL